MINFIKRKLEKRRLKKTFKEYGFEMKSFELANEGELKFAQWLHPFEQPRSIGQENVDFYKQFVNKGDFAIDIGAHIGDTTVPMAFAAGKEGLILALEPNPYVFKILEENSRLNTANTNIKPINFAVVEHDGKFVFNYSDASYCNGGFLSNLKTEKHHHHYSLEVEGKNLENFLNKNYKDYLGKLSLIKIDAEGYDKEIIKSIRSVITKYKPSIISECYKRLTREERNELYSVIKELNYKLFYVEDFNTLNKTEILQEEDMMKWRHFDMILIPEE